MAATFTVRMSNDLDEPIARGDLVVDVGLPSGWGLLHVTDETSYPISDDATYELPLDTPVQTDEGTSFTFTVGERVDYPLPTPAEGTLELVFRYKQTPLTRAEVLLPPGRET